MSILRTILMVLLLIGFMIFAIYNWEPVEIRLWQNLVMETKVPMLALLAFMAGFLPMWAYHLSTKWAMRRRMRSLETSLKNSAVARPASASAVFTPSAGDVSVDKPDKTAGEAGDTLSPIDTGTAKGGAVK